MSLAGSASSVHRSRWDSRISAGDSGGGAWSRVPYREVPWKGGDLIPGDRKRLGWEVRQEERELSQTHPGRD